MNAVHLIQADAVAPQAWRNGGGQTRELLAWPTRADWQLRISRADIDVSGPFSAFPGVQRWFVVLSGNGVELQLPAGKQPRQNTSLRPGHLPFHFDGGLAPACTLIDGPTQDLNLMARAGKAVLQPVQAGVAWSEPYAVRGLYTACKGVWSCGPRTQALAAHTLLWLSPAEAQAMRFSSANPAQAWWLGYTPQGSA